MKTCYVTGGAGFIGSQSVHALEQQLSHLEVVVVDDFSDGHKVVENLSGARIADCIDKDRFLDIVETGKHRALPAPDAMLHLGARSSAAAWDGGALLDDNYRFSKAALHWCLSHSHSPPFVYASSAAVYGATQVADSDVPRHEHPINMYAWSKWQFDQYVRHYLREHPHAPICGLRYFNVYGPGEWHKGERSSMVLRAYRQLESDGVVRLFGAGQGYGDGEHRRDFVWVNDCVSANVFLLLGTLLHHKSVNGIFDVGTGQARSFNELARAVIDWWSTDSGREGRIEYVPFPDELRASYQPFTQADTSALRSAGFEHRCASLEQAVPKYLERVKQRERTRRGDAPAGGEHG